MRNRDFVLLRGRHHENSIYYQFDVSTQHSKKVPDATGSYVRGKIIISGYAFQPDGPSCNVTYIAQVDPGGFIPAFVCSPSSKLII